jgi:hypothetical protein
MNTPHSTPVTAAEIANLLARLRTLSPPPHGAAARAQFLAATADQHAHEWPCDHAAQARQVVADARVVADHARALVEPAGIDATDDSP